MTTRRICLYAMLVALLSGGKTVLAFIPNVEVVTLILIVSALTVGKKGSLLVCTLFILIEILIWGFNPWWVILYVIHWNSLVLVVGLLPKNKARIPLAITLGILFTAMYGVLSTVIEICFMGAVFSPNFLKYFYFRYVAGVPFFLTHIISNSVILSVLTPMFYKLFNRLISGFLKNGRMIIKP